MHDALAQKLPHIAQELLDVGRLPNVTAGELEARQARLREAYEQNKDHEAFWQSSPEIPDDEGF